VRAASRIVAPSGAVHDRPSIVSWVIAEAVACPG